MVSFVEKTIDLDFPAIMYGVTGVVVSCKIPILATRVRFPGDAYFFSTCFLFDWTLLSRVAIAALSIQGIDDEMLKF